MNNVKKTISVDCDNLEWLYVRDVDYVKYDNCVRKMQLFIPFRREWQENTKYPLVLFMPGSAWYEQEMYNSIGEYAKLAQRGYVTAIVQFRESTIAPYPAQIYDLDAAIRFLIEKQEEFHIDVNNIYLAGNSSGGHIALMTALSKAHGIIQGNYDIAGVIALSSPTDIDMCLKEPLPEWMTDRPSHDLLGTKAIGESTELIRRASCGPYISEGITLPDILLFHGTQDQIVSIEQSRLLYRQLTDANKNVSFYELEGEDHGGPAFWSKEVLNIIDDFIQTSND